MAREEPQNRNGPMERLKDEVGELAGALTNRAVTSLLDRVEGTTDRLNEYVEGGAGPGLMAAVTGAKGLAEGKSPARSMLGAAAGGRNAHTGDGGHERRDPRAGLLSSQRRSSSAALEYHTGASGRLPAGPERCGTADQRTARSPRGVPQPER